MIRKIFKYVTPAGWSVVFAICVALLTVGCSGNDEGDAGRDKAPSDASGFRFLDLNAASRLDDSLRKDLRDKLGSDAVWRRAPLDIEINYSGFLKQHFEELHRLNRRLNYAPRERVEHDITKLMYRYPQKKNLPFSYIELVFSSRSGEPLVFNIQARQDGDALIATLEDKYGLPGSIEWNNGKDRALFWRSTGEIMIASIVEDRYGQPEYGISIYFIDHIEKLVVFEEQERRQMQKQTEKAGKTAF
ncbi:hypothetical protein D3OALGA1CA_5637 [Olavius algarvensis associated proteobacterium Delta 3]|nr:hypothetical protein D3OALGB2SA_14 [Olavius algarvensis associated proteobacterium Delta 3]CAB5169391.1 hypothetical protein D3OALGA1CA_5637 [Olavius algarvensis associated proteobacterium Delta 3]